MNGRMKFGRILGAAGALMVAGALVLGPTIAQADPPADPNGVKNATTCAEVGFPLSTQFNGPITSDVYNAGLFTVTITSNQFVTISGIADGVDFQAVVVKGGDAYNVYYSLVANMQSPLNNGGNVPTISHWFACYTYTPPTSSSEGPTTSGAPTTAGAPSTGDEVENLPPVPEEQPESGALPQTGWLGTNLTLLLGLGMLAAGGLAIGLTRRAAKS